MNQYVPLTGVNTLGQPMVDIDQVTADVGRLIHAGCTPGEALRLFVAEVPDHGLALSDLAAIIERVPPKRAEHVRFAGGDVTYDQFLRRMAAR